MLVGVGGGITLPCSHKDIFTIMGRDSAGAEGDHQGEAAEASEASNAQGYFLTGAHVDPVDDIAKLVGSLVGTYLFRTGGATSLSGLV